MNNDNLDNYKYFQARFDLIKKELEREEFTNLFFSGIDGIVKPIKLQFQHPILIKKIEMSLHDIAFFHIKGIEFLKNGILLSENQKYTFSISSYDQGKNIENFNINKIYDKFAFHTQKEKDPWAHIEFINSIEVDSIIIYNRQDTLSQANRGKNFSIKVFSENNTIISNVDINRLRMNFYDALTEHYNVYSLPLNKESRINIDKIIFETYSGNYFDVKTYFDSISLETGNDLKQFLSKEILHARKREYTSYGIKSTFRFWTIKEKTAYIRETLSLIKVLTEICPHVCYGFGTVLGFVREKDFFIPHDSDIDIICAFPENCWDTPHAVVNKLIAHLNHHNYVISKPWTRAVKIKSRSPAKQLDVFLGQIDSENNVSLYPYHRGKYLHMDYLFPAIQINILGEQCPIPRNPFQYLDITYGNNWRIPIDKQFHKLQK